MKYIIDLPDGLGEGLMALVTGSDGMCMTRVERPASCWIPVSERQPEKYGEYLVSTSNGYVVSDYYASYGWDDDCDKDYVVAWMPLPESYKEEQE